MCIITEEVAKQAAAALLKASRKQPTKKTFGAKAAPLRLSFEDTLASALERICKRQGVPVWRSGGFRMTSVFSLCRVLRLATTRDYNLLANTIEVLGDDYGRLTVNHVAECDETLDGVPMPKRANSAGVTHETPLIYLDKADEVVRMALKIKGPKHLAEFTARIVVA